MATTNSKHRVKPTPAMYHDHVMPDIAALFFKDLRYF